MKYYFQCPRCQNDERFTEPEEDTSNLGCTLFFLGGLLPSLLFLRAMKRRVQCGKCGYIFQQPSIPRTAVSSLAIWINTIIFFCLLLIAIPIFSPFWMQAISNKSNPWEIEKLVIENPRAFIIGVGLIIGIITPICMISSVLSNHNERNRIGRQYETKPKLRQGPRPTQPTEDE